VADYLVSKSREKFLSVSVVCFLYNVLAALNVAEDQSLMLETVVVAAVVVVAVVVVAAVVLVVVAAVVLVVNNLVVAVVAVPVV
jgi:hypothetical protein